jgi:phosphohistidine swiveling domain-containing protein
MTAEATAIGLEGLAFEPPSPGSWELDATHYPRPVARFMTDPRAYSEPMGRGFGWSLRRYGLPILYPERGFVNGFAYRCVRPAPHEEMAERFGNAARAFEARLWRQDLEHWDRDLKPATIQSQLVLQRIDPFSLDREALLEHLSACYAHLERMVEQAYRLVAPALVPLGDFLVQGSDLSGVSPAELLVLTRGSAPVSAGAEDGLGRLAAAVRAGGHALGILQSESPAAEILSELRRCPAPVGPAASEYLEMVECRLVDGFEVGYPCGFELPEVLVGAIRGAVEDERSETVVEEDTARVRDRVPPNQRDRFDELLAEARLTYRLRDERSVYGMIWAFGLMRRAILAAGRRLAGEGSIGDPADLLEAWFGEIVSLLRGGGGPSAAELAELAHFRSTHAAADAPSLLGDEPHPPPSPDGFPQPAARALKAVGTCLRLLYGDADADSDRTVVRGLPASPGVYEGTARLLAGPEQLARLSSGEVLVTPSTSEAFNVVLPLVGAIVTDHGGLLSHAAVVAREFGVPSVVGTRDGTRLIADDARVRVDGGAGEVTVIG